MHKHETDRMFPENSVFGIYGAGGFGREVMPVLYEYLHSKFPNDLNIKDRMYFIETNPSKNEVNGYKLISESDFFTLKGVTKYFNVAIADSVARERLSKACLANGALPISVISNDAKLYDENHIDEGLIMCSNSIITSNTKIGRFFHAYMLSYVAHDCVIGDFVSFGPRVSVNGNVHIDDHAYIGASAVIKEGSKDKPLVIGEGAIVGMGAVVTKDVAPYSVVVGNPARPLKKK